MSDLEARGLAEYTREVGERPARLSPLETLAAVVAAADPRAFEGLTRPRITPEQAVAWLEEKRSKR